MLLTMTGYAAIPSTDFASEYAFTGTAATLEDGLIKETHWGEDRAYIRYDGGMHSFAAASWEVQSTRSGFVNVRVYTATNEWEEHTSSPYGNSGHNFSVEIYNSSEVRLDTIAEGVYAPSPWDGYRTYPAEGIALGTLYIPEAGTYTIKLKNMRDYSRCGVDSVTFTYAGGERINIPDTLRPIDALLSEKALRIQAATGDTLIFAPRGSEGYASDVDYTVAGSQYVKWNFEVKKAGLYKFTASTRSFNGHNYRILVYNEDESLRIDSIQEMANGTFNHSKNAGEELLIATDAIRLSAGNYVLKMQNKANSKGSVMWVAASYEGGNTIVIPGTLDSEEAILSSNGSRADGVISISGWSSGYVKWFTKIETTKSLYYDVKLDVLSNSGNGHTFTVAFYEDENEPAVASVSESVWKSTSGTLNLGRVLLPGGKTYICKVTNSQGNGSTARIVGASISYAGGEKIEIPGMLYGKDALLEPKKLYRDENACLHYNDNGSPTNEYAYWRIHTTAAYSGKVILDIPVESGDHGHEFHVELYSDLEGSKLSEAIETSTSKFHNGLIELPETFTISAAGDYFVKIINHTQYSHAILRGISIAPTVTLSETATDLENLTEGAAVNVQLTRSFVAGMYNTICLPFAVSAAEMGRVFPGAVVKELTSSSVEEGDFVLNLNFSAVSEMEAGVPYIIKPAADVVNPKFIGVTIDKTLRNTETTNADFVGNFVAGTIPADENNLFLGANNTLYFPTVDMPILGMRAYFVIHDAPAGAVKRARIIEREQIITDVELVAEQPNAKSQKILRNGQLIIIRDGNMYNVMGAKLQ